MEDKCHDQHCDTYWPGEAKQLREVILKRFKNGIGQLDGNDLQIVRDSYKYLEDQVKHLRKKIELHRSHAWQGQFQNLNVSMGEAMIRTIERETLDLVLKFATEEYGKEEISPFEHIIKLIYERD